MALLIYVNAVLQHLKLLVFYCEGHEVITTKILLLTLH